MLALLLIILLLEGFITISVEILTLRQLTPFYGGSVVITSIIIGFFLLFLAMGYWRGGLQRNEYMPKLCKNFLYSMICIGIGLSYDFIAVFSYLSTVKLALPSLISLTLYLLLILAPIVYCLGQTIPITTNLFNQNQGVSRISGKALFLSTIGSFLGAIVTSLILFQYLGVASTLVFNCLLLYLLVLFMQLYLNQFSWILLPFAVALFFIIALNLYTEKTTFLKTNNYGNYQVVTFFPQTKLLKINESYSSMQTETKQGFAYIELIRDILFKQLKLQHQEILVIGAGGFTLSAAGTNNNDFTYIDIDPDIKALAEKNFLQQKIKGKFIGEDARLFLNQTKKRYDVIISDVYSNKVTIPPSLLTLEYFQQLANHLNESGLLIINIIASPLFADRFSQSIDNTIRKVFKHCNIIPLDFLQHSSNIIFVCPKSANHALIYTDDLNNSTFDYFNSTNEQF